MSFSSVDISYYAPEFKVFINGSQLAGEMSKTILSIRVDQAMNRLNNFSFDVQDEFCDGRFKWLGHDLFKYGNDITIQLGYANNLADFLKGKIQNIHAQFNQGINPHFTVEGSDSAYQFLMNNSVPHEFVDKTDSQIVQEIAWNAQLQAQVEDTTMTHSTKFKESGVTYFSFLEELANENGFQLSLAGRELYFGPSRPPSDTVVELAWGKELISFSPEINTSQAVSEVIVLGWDRNQRETIKGHARAGDEENRQDGSLTASQLAREIYGDIIKVITDQPVTSNEEATQLAVSTLEQISSNLVQGSGETIGNPEIKPGASIHLSGLGEWFSGGYVVESASHQINENGYRTNFTVKRNCL